jgi:hypothetical protein
MDILQELQRSGLQISPITSNAIDKLGLGDITFKSAILKYPDSLQLNFLVNSSHGKGEEKHFSNNGDYLSFSGGYKVTIQFINFGNIAPSNLLSLALSQQIIYIKEIFDKADIKVSCDCGAWYWQGTSELLDRNPPEANYEGFTGQPGKGIWDILHNTKNRICKHIYHVLEELNYYIPKILKNINKGTSLSSSTIQNTTLQAPQKSAGIPKKSSQGIEKTSTINAEKAKSIIEKNIEEEQSTAENLDLPNMDISKVNAKSHKGESDAISGTEKTEPPIEEITLRKKQDENKDQNRELPEIFHESLLKKLKELEEFKSSAIIEPNGKIHYIEEFKHDEIFTKLLFPIKSNNHIIDEALSKGYIRISTFQKYNMKDASSSIDVSFFTPESKSSLIDFILKLNSKFLLNNLYFNSDKIELENGFIDEKDFKRKINKIEIIEKNMLREIKIKSPKDFKLWKEWYKSDAYLYITFENFKKQKLKNFGQILKEILNI